MNRNMFLFKYSVLHMLGRFREGMTKLGPGGPVSCRL